jgi:hypothetical protein
MYNKEDSFEIFNYENLDLKKVCKVYGFTEPPKVFIKNKLIN